MFALAQLPATLTIGGAVALGVVGLLVAGGATYGIARFVKSRRNKKIAVKSQPLPHLSGLLHGLGNVDLSAVVGSPLVQEMLKVALPAIHQAQQVAVNTAVARMLPQLAPYIPDINKAVADLDNVMDARLGIGDNAPSTPPAAAGATIVVPPGHPVLELLQKTLEARQQQQSQQSNK